MAKTFSIIDGPRIPVIEFYSNFKNFNIQMLVGSDHQFNQEISLPTNTQLNSFILKGLPPSKSTNLSLKYFPKLENWIKKTDVVGISDTYYAWNYQASYLAKKHHKPLITIIWCNMPHHISSWLPPYSYFTKHVIKNTTHFILRNHKARVFTQSVGIPDSKTTIIYPGIDLQKFKPNLPKSQNDKVKILYIGQLTKAKGVLDLLEAFTKLCTSHKNIELHIAGSGELQKIIISATRQLPIFYHGFCQYSTLPTLYQNADIFCSPSKTQKICGITINQEYFPYTLLEAQASGLPIVSTTIGGIPEAVAPGNMLIREGDTNTLVHTLTQLVEDQKLRSEIALTNRKHAKKNYDIVIQSKLTEDMILQLI